MDDTRGAMRLNLGCGFDLREHYLNVDRQAFHHPDCVADVAALPLANARCDEVFAQDLLEHLPRTATSGVLSEWRRVLADRGALRLRVPDLIGLSDLLRASDDVGLHLALVQNLFGTQAYTGDFHLTSFTDVTLVHELLNAGFGEIVMSRRDTWLFDVVAMAMPPGSRPERASLTLGRGFSHQEGAWWPYVWTWAGRTAAVEVLNLDARSRRMQLALDIELADAKGSVDLLVDGELLGHIDAGATDSGLGLDVPAGRSVIELKYQGDVADAPGDDRELAFRVFRASLSSAQAEVGA